MAGEDNAAFVCNMDVKTFLSLVSEETGLDHVQAWRTHLGTGQRVGQAFVNALRGSVYYDRIAGHPLDPFHRDHLKACYEAINYLTSKEPV